MYVEKVVLYNNKTNKKVHKESSWDPIRVAPHR